MLKTFKLAYCKYSENILLLNYNRSVKELQYEAKRKTGSANQLNTVFFN